MAQKRKKILIHGGAGSVGRIGVQLAKLHGAHVTTTVSDWGVSVVKDLGADRIINYRTERFEQSGRQFDMVLDLVGSDTLDRSFQAAKPGGTVISIAGLPEPNTAKDIGRGRLFALLFAIASRKQRKLARDASASYRYVFMKPNGSQLETIGKWVDEGKLRVAIDRVFPINAYREAFDYQASGKPKGKIIFSMEPWK